MFSKAATSALYLVGYHVAQGRGVLVTAEQLAQVYGLSPHSVTRVVQELAKARILMSHRGRGGGFSKADDRAARKEPIEASGEVSLAQ